MTEAQYDVLCGVAQEELMEKQGRLAEVFGLGGLPQWRLDHRDRTLEFRTAAGRAMVRAAIVAVGSFAPRSQTWLWAWANASLPDESRTASSELRGLETVTGKALFGASSAFRSTEAEAWDLTALAVRHLGAFGAYRAPCEGGPHTFLALMTVESAPFLTATASRALEA